MSSVREAEKAVRELSGDQLAEFRRWFYEFDASAWDAQFETDANSGNLDEQAETAITDYRAGRTPPF